MTTKTSSAWRQEYRVHPAADVFPMMTDEELASLGKDIKENGLRSPLAVTDRCWPDENGVCDVRRRTRYVLDGCNRLDAMERVGIQTIGAKGKRKGLLDPHIEGKPIEGFDLVDVDWEEAAAYVISANIRRRHLTKQQQADLIVAIARMTVEKKLVDDQPVSGGEMPNIPPELDRRGGRGGRGKKNPIKAEALKLNQALPKEQQVGMSTIKTALAKAEGKEPKPKETYRAPLRRKPKLETNSPLEAARHFHIEKCIAAGVAIEKEIELFAAELRDARRTDNG